MNATMETLLCAWCAASVDLPKGVSVPAGWTVDETYRARCPECQPSVASGEQAEEMAA